MFCKNCRSEIAENSNFCDKCGAEASTVKTKEQYNTLSIIGFVVACVSLLLNFWGIVGIGAVILSSLGFVQVKKTGEKGKGIAIAGIAIGAFSIVYATIMIVCLMV